MVSAPDVITYIGVPLAVLGVLPIIYTALRSLLTLRSIKKSLSDNAVSAITRGSLLSGVIEVEIPRMRILPFDRTPDSETHFELLERASTLRGGSWTLLNWRTMIIGSKTYRLRYKDDLRQPQVEIDFEPLVAYLLDLGAMPTKQGFRGLKNAGLWTPPGTVLMVWPATGETVLKISSPDDSDGILSLAMNWRASWDHEKLRSLPPYCIRIENTLLFPKATTQESPPEKTSNDDHDTSSTPPPQRLLLQFTSTGLSNPPPHLKPTPKSTTTPWLASAATAFHTARASTTLWSFTIPQSLTTLTTTPTIPIGILELSGLLTPSPETPTPQWRTRAPPVPGTNSERQMQRLREQSQSRLEEMKMTEPERSVAVMARQRREAQAFLDEHRRKELERRQEREQEVLDAVRSEKVGVGRVGTVALRWLAEEGVVAAGDGLEEVVEGAVWAIVRDESLGRGVLDMLGRWEAWSSGAGMTGEDLAILQSEKKEFTVAACVVALIAAAAESDSDGVSGDLRECLCTWKMVRLG